MDLNQIRAQVFGIAHAINTQWKATKQVSPGVSQQLGDIAGLLDRFEPLMQQWEQMGSTITQGASPSQSLAPQTPAQQPKPEGGSAGKISPDAQPVIASWLEENCKFAKKKKKKKHSTCPGCSSWVGHWMTSCPGCGNAVGTPGASCSGSDGASGSAPAAPTA